MRFKTTRATASPSPSLLIIRPAGQQQSFVDHPDQQTLRSCSLGPVLEDRAVRLVGQKYRGGTTGGPVVAAINLKDTESPAIT